MIQSVCGALPQSPPLSSKQTGTMLAKNKALSIAEKEAGTILVCPLETKDGKRAGGGGSLEKTEKSCTEKSKGEQSS